MFFYLMVTAFYVLKNLCLSQGFKGIFLCFLVENKAFILRSIIYFKLIFVNGIRKRSSFIFSIWMMEMEEYHLLKRLSFPNLIMLAFAKK